MSVEISSASVEPIRFTYLVDGEPLVGASLTVGVTRTTAGGTLEVLDWDAELFTTFDLALSPTIELSPLDATDAPGVYGRMFDMAFPSNAAVGDIYTVTVREGDEVLDEWEIRNTFVNTLNSRASSAEVAAVPAAVWTATISSNTTITQAGGMVHLLRAFAINRLEEDEGNPGSLILYKDDNVTPWCTFTLRDQNGNAVVGATGEVARRSAAVVT